MKKLILLPAIAFAGLSPVISLVSCGDPAEPGPEPEYGDFHFEYDSDFAKLTGYEGTLPENLLIPGYHSFPGHPDCPVSIGDHAFYNTNIKSVTIEEGAYDIGFFAFAKCYKLKEVNLPDSLDSIFDFAFESCAIENVFIPENLDYIALNPWSNCNLQSITADSNNVKYYVKNNCLLLRPSHDEYTRIELVANNFTIPTDIENLALGSYCMSGLESLETLYIPKNVNHVGSEYGPIYNCQNLKTINVDQENSKFLTTEEGKNLFFKLNDGGTETSLTVCLSNQFPNDERIIKVLNGAFSSNSSITNIVIPKNVSEIVNGAFMHCNSITSITVDQDNETYVSPEGSNVILEDRGDGEWGLLAFFPTSTIPSDATSYPNIDLDYYCCILNDSISAIDIPENVSAIDEGAFDGTNLETVTYAGTLYQWKYLVGEGEWCVWHNYIPCATVVTCSDGTITYNAWE